MVYLAGANANVFDLVFSVIIAFHFKVFFRLSLRKTHKKYGKALDNYNPHPNSCQFNQPYSCFIHLTS
jgi:hypothetical protein